MKDVIRNLIAGDYAPHGYCLLWRPWLVWTMAISDALIALAYFSIPIALVTFVRKRRDVAFGGVFWLFALFITACGLTHVAAIWNLWNGAYELEAIIKLVTAAASVLTALLLWPLLPRAIALPSPAHLREANEALRAEMAQREKAEAALVQSRKMEAMGQLTGGIAHDFNNLLQVIGSSLDLIAARAGADERIPHLASSALAAVDRGRRLTNQLLSFSRIQRIELKPVRVDALMAEVKELLGRTIEPAIRIVFDGNDRPDSVLADAMQLELGLINLALNARDAMPDGGTLRFSVANERLEGRDDVPDGDYLAITVSDTGSGMTEDVIARAFEPFFTTKGIGHGSGLGLSMVFGMARQSGGTVTIESIEGEGSAITLFLRRVEAQPTPDTGPDLDLRAKFDRLTGLDVLVVDDEEHVRDVVAELLEALGCRVRVASGGEQALEMLEQQTSEAMLVDFAMPGMNGAEVASVALLRHPHLRIVFATGFAQSDAIDAAVGENAIVLRKPFTPAALAGALRRAMA